MVFAIISDFWERKPFFILNGFLLAISNLIYYLAHTPLDFLFGKVTEGMKSASLWAVNRASLMESSEKKWRVLVHLRTVSYVSSAVGSLLAGIFVLFLFFKGTLMLCVLIGAIVVPLSLLLRRTGKRRELNMTKALHTLDFRKKKRLFKECLVLFFMMGLSFGFVSGFVYPLFLSENGFDAEAIGVLLGLQILLAGLVSYFFSRRFEIRRLILFSGLLYTFALILVGFSSFLLAAILVVAYGAVEGLLGIGQEGIVSKITNEESYGTDIGLLWMGHHIGRTLSLAMSGLIISTLGFAAPFLISALLYSLFYMTFYFILGE
jgi:MFS family permease